MHFSDVSEAAALFALSFLSEDAAVLSAAVLVAGGGLSWDIGFAACFLGIWIGDLWLYGMARIFGAPFVSRFKMSAAVQRSRVWFEKRGPLVLVISRIVPGLRLPGYLAAGAMRFPLSAFTAITGIVAAIWVGAIFAVGQSSGLAKIPVIREHAIWLAFAAVALSGGVALCKPAFRGGRIHGFAAEWRRRLQRWLQWEFWPAWLFYAPVAGFYLWLSIRHRGATLPTSANPGMPMGGLVGESKFDTLSLLQQANPESVAQSWLLEGDSTEMRVKRLQSIVESFAVEMPFILKPDVGQRGAGVKLIKSFDAAREYLHDVKGSVILQRYVKGPDEVGIFYYRKPGESSGHIFAITEKIFPSVVGDGVHTLEELILADPRASIVSDTYLRRFESDRGRVLPRGEELQLVQAGNHAQGCIFRDGMHLAAPALAARIDQISQSIPGFYIGRYDVRYASDEQLRAGESFQIVELNGASAEATSIYDARRSLMDAYRTLYRQWSLVFEIGAMNRALGVRPVGIRDIFREWRRANAAIRTYPFAD